MSRGRQRASTLEGPVPSMYMEGLETSFPAFTSHTPPPSGSRRSDESPSPPTPTSRKKSGKRKGKMMKMGSLSSAMSTLHMGGSPKSDSRESTPDKPRKRLKKRTSQYRASTNSIREMALSLSLSETLADAGLSGEESETPTKKTSPKKTGFNLSRSSSNVIPPRESSTARDAAERSLVDILDMEAAARKRLKGLEEMEKAMMQNIKRMNKSNTPPVSRKRSSKKLRGTMKKKDEKPLMAYTNKDWRFASLGRYLGSGGSNTRVYLCHLDKWTCAVKELKIQEAGLVDIASMENEASIMSFLPPHQNVVPLLDFDRSIYALRLFMPVYDLTLREMIDQRAQTRDYFPIRDIALIALEVAKGLQHCHRHNVIHRDVKANNVFLRRAPIDPNTDRFKKAQPMSEIRIADFDSAVLMDDAKEHHMLFGTPGFTAPEMIRANACEDSNTKGYGGGVDVFAFGMMLFEMMTLSFPYLEIDRHDISDAILSGRAPEFPPELARRYKKLIPLHLRCINKDPNHRPSWEEICRNLLGIHIFFTGENHADVTASPFGNDIVGRAVSTSPRVQSEDSVVAGPLQRVNRARTIGPGVGGVLLDVSQLKKSISKKQNSDETQTTHQSSEEEVIREKSLPDSSSSTSPSPRQPADYPILLRTMSFADLNKMMTAAVEDDDASYSARTDSSESLDTQTDNTDECFTHRSPMVDHEMDYNY